MHGLMWLLLVMGSLGLLYQNLRCLHLPQRHPYKRTSGAFNRPYRQHKFSPGVDNGLTMETKIPRQPMDPTIRFRNGQGRALEVKARTL